MDPRMYWAPRGPRVSEWLCPHPRNELPGDTLATPVNIDDELRMNPYTVHGPEHDDTEHAAVHDTLQHLQLYDDTVREHELIKLRQKIQTVIDDQAEYGQFEVWWRNMNRTHTITAPAQVRERHTSFRRTPATYRHNDDFLRALLRDAQERRDYALRQRSRNIEPSEYYVDDTRGTNVDLAWRTLLLFFYGDRDNERWQRSTWHEGNPRGPHRP